MKNSNLPWGVYEGRRLVAAFRTRREAREFAKLPPILDEETKAQLDRAYYAIPLTPKTTRLGILDERDGVPFYKPLNRF